MTEDIRPKWKNVARRMQSVACKQNGYAIVTIQVLVGPSGDPAFWFEPALRKIEPMQSSGEFLHELFIQGFKHHDTT